MSPAPPESEIVRVIRAFKAALLADEEAQLARMARAYLDVEHALADNIAALSEQLARLKAEGQEVPFWKILRLERWQRLQAQTMSELARFNGWAVAQIENEQLRLGVLGMQHAAQAAETAKPGISAMLDRLPHDAFRGMVGLAGDGSPLSVLLAKSGPAVRDAMLRELQRSVALGRNPKVTAAAVRKATGMGLQRAVTIARTEQLRVYREATLQSYRAMSVTMYERLPAYDANTCICCISRAGEVVSSEFAIDDHVAGRCSAIPLVPGVENPTIESGQSWFDRQDEATKRSIMGPGRYEAYKSGAAKWSDMATLHRDPVWGDTYHPTRVSDLVAGKTSAAA